MTKVFFSYFLVGTSHSFHGRLGNTAETFCGISLCLELTFTFYHFQKIICFTYLQVCTLQVYRNFLLANEYQSSKLCEARFSECEDKMDHLQVLKLPSMAKFNAGFTHCNQSFVRECVGPAKESYERRMSKVCLLILNIVCMLVIKEEV